MLVVLGLSACSGKPSSRIISKALELQLEDQGLDQLFDIRNVTKTNGYVDGEDRYVADVEYDLVFKQSYQELADQLEENDDGELLSTIGAGIGLIAIRLQYGEFNAGDTEHQVSRLNLINTEQGWRIRD